MFGRNDETLVVKGQHGRQGARRSPVDNPTMHLYASRAGSGAGMSFSDGNQGGQEYAYINLPATALEALYKYFDNIFGKPQTEVVNETFRTTLNDQAWQLAGLAQRVSVLEAAAKGKTLVSLDNVKPFWDGGKIPTIKRLREMTGEGLIECKNTVERWFPRYTPGKTYTFGDTVAWQGIAYRNHGGTCYAFSDSSDDEVGNHFNGVYSGCGWKKV